MNRIVLLWLLVIFVGIQFGAGCYEKLAIVSLWSSVPPDQVLATMDATGMYRAGRAFWPFVSPVVALLAIVNLVVAWRTPVPYRRWWIGGAALMTLYAVVSYSYFVPQMLVFQSDGASWDPQRVETFVDWWTGLNYVRMTIGGIGWLCALRALSFTGTDNRTREPAKEHV